MRGNPCGSQRSIGSFVSPTGTCCSPSDGLLSIRAAFPAGVKARQFPHASGRPDIVGRPLAGLLPPPSHPKSRTGHGPGREMTSSRENQPWLAKPGPTYHLLTAVTLVTAWALLFEHA